MNCSNCQAAMNELTLDAQEQRTVTIDVCMKCQAFWFDKFESLQLTPASTLKLLEMIGEQNAERPVQFEKDMACPRCGILLRPTQDMQRTTRFNYFRCSNGHGASFASSSFCVRRISSGRFHRRRLRSCDNVFRR